MKPACVVILLLILPAVHSLGVDLSVEKVFVAESLYFRYNDTINEFSTEIINSGSLPYAAQIRVDAINSNGTVFTAWSERKRMMPGNNGFFQLYWAPESPGNYTTRYRVYYGGEINETTRSIIVGQIPWTRDVFNLTLLHVLDNFLIMEVEAGSGMEKAVIIPYDYPQGTWIGQKLLTIKASQARKVIIPYSSPYQSLDVKFVVASPDNRYVTKKTLTLEKGKSENELLRLLFSLLDA